MVGSRAHGDRYHHLILFDSGEASDDALREEEITAILDRQE